MFTVNSGVTATLTALTIQHGNTANNGGGINNSGTLTVTNSTVSANSANNGGGINNSGTLTVTNGFLSANSANNGGGINNSGMLTVTNGFLSGNGGSTSGGGINNSGMLTVTNSILSGNGGSTSGGGGINNNGGTLTVTNGFLSGNIASIGGGINNSGGTLTVTNSTFSSNTASNNGGGLAVNIGMITVTNSTFASNTASNDGGGIYANIGTLTVTNSTLARNTASNGGGIYHASGNPFTLTNTIVALNTFTGGGNNRPDLVGPFMTGGHNLIGTIAGSSGIVGGTNGDIVNNTPLLGTLSDNGGPTQTIPLLPGSPAIANGDSAVCTTTGVGKVNGLDGRGVARPTTLCAIGAFEPLLSVISPASGGVDGGALVTLTGAGFVMGSTTVSIGGAACTNVQIGNNGTSLRCTAGSARGGGSGCGSDDGGRDGNVGGRLHVRSDYPGTDAAPHHGPANGRSDTDAGGACGCPHGTADTASCSHAAAVARRDTWGGMGDGDAWHARRSLPRPRSTIHCCPSIISRIKNVHDRITTLALASRGSSPYSAKGSHATSERVLRKGVVMFACFGMRRAFVTLVGCALAVLGGLLLTPPIPVAAATTYFVGNIGDTTTTTGCTSAVNMTCTLRDAISVATTAGDTITFTNAAFPANTAKTITLTTNTTLTLGTSVTIDGTGHRVIVDGNCTLTSGVCSSGGVTVFTVGNGKTVNLTALTIQHGNTATSGRGGGILNNGGILAVTNSTLTANSAGGGGGIGNNGGTLTVTNSTFFGNTTTIGGGIFQTSGTATVTNSTLSGNSASGGGGGITIYAGMFTVTNSTLSGNTASNGFGGGINNTNGTLTVTNSTLYNSSANTGGGIYHDGGMTTVTNSTLSGNSAVSSGGIRNNNGTVTLTNTIVAGSLALGGGPNLNGTFTSGGHNLIDVIDGSSSGITNGDAQGDMVNPNPGLGPFGNYGGPTQTIPLLSGSPAIAHGDPTICNQQGAGKVNGLDQRGLPRPTSFCSIGAFEPQDAAYTVGSTSDSGSAGALAACQTPANTTCRLRDALGLAPSVYDRETITFNGTGSGTITLSAGTLTLVGNVTIDGTGRSVIVDGGCTFSGGACTGVTGVRVFTVNSGVTATLTALTIQHGNGGTGGSGILNNGGTLTVTNSTLTANSATSGNGNSGGGINNNGGTLTVTNSTLSGNSAIASGGGIFNNGPLTVTNSTFSGNSATSGGGIFNYSGTARLTNTIVAGNTGSSGLNLNGTFTSGGHNLIGTTSGSTGITNGTNGDIVNPNPLLGALSDNGGPTPTIPLLTGSPAIAHGDPTICNQTGVGKVNGLDGRGVARPTTLCAIGAFEPLLSAIAPASGGIDGGAPVTLTGAGFVIGGTTVSIGGGACTNVQIGDNGTSLRCTAGAHAAGMVDVVVTVGTTTGTLTNGYTYGVIAPAPMPPRPTAAPMGAANAMPGARASAPTVVPPPLPAPTRRQ